jgi:hypothetical protein
MVLALGLLGGGLAGFLGFKSYANTHDPKQRVSIEFRRALVEEADKKGVGGAHVQKLRDEVSRFDRLGRLCYIMLAAGLLGVAAGVLAFLRRGKLAAPLMLLPAAGAAVLFVPSLVMTAPLVLGGLLSLLIRSRPRARPA